MKLNVKKSVIWLIILLMILPNMLYAEGALQLDSIAVTGSIEGTALNQDGLAASDAVIVLYQQQDGQYQDVKATNANSGKYHFDNLQPGDYKVKAGSTSGMHFNFTDTNEINFTITETGDYNGPESTAISFTSYYTLGSLRLMEDGREVGSPKLILVAADKANTYSWRNASYDVSMKSLSKSGELKVALQSGDGMWASDVITLKYNDGHFVDAQGQEVLEYKLDATGTELLTTVVNMDNQVIENGGAFFSFGDKMHLQINAIAGKIYINPTWFLSGHYDYRAYNNKGQGCTSEFDIVTVDGKQTIANQKASVTVYDRQLSARVHYQTKYMEDAYSSAYVIVSKLVNDTFEAVGKFPVDEMAFASLGGFREGSYQAVAYPLGDLMADYTLSAPLAFTVDASGNASIDMLHLTLRTKAEIISEQLEVHADNQTNSFSSDAFLGHIEGDPDSKALDSNGFVSMSVDGLEDGMYQFYADNYHYSTLERLDFEVKSGKVVGEIMPYVLDSPQVKFTVTTANEEDIYGVHYTLTNNLGQSFYFNKAEEFSLAGLPSGSYTMTIKTENELLSKAKVSFEILEHQSILEKNIILHNVFNTGEYTIPVNNLSGRKQTAENSFLCIYYQTSESVYHQLTKVPFTGDQLKIDAAHMVGGTYKLAVSATDIDYTHGYDLIIEDGQVIKAPDAIEYTAPRLDVQLFDGEQALSIDGTLQISTMTGVRYVDMSGSHLFADLSPGNYTLRFEPEDQNNYAPQTVEITLPEQTTLYQVKINLSKPDHTASLNLDVRDGERAVSHYSLEVKYLLDDIYNTIDDQFDRQTHILSNLSDGSYKLRVLPSSDAVPTFAPSQWHEFEVVDGKVMTASAEISKLQIAIPRLEASDWTAVELTKNGQLVLDSQLEFLGESVLSYDRLNIAGHFYFKKGLMESSDEVQLLFKAGETAGNQDGFNGHSEVVTLGCQNGKMTFDGQYKALQKLEIYPTDHVFTLVDEENNNRNGFEFQMQLKGVDHDFLINWSLGFGYTILSPQALPQGQYRLQFLEKQEGQMQSEVLLFKVVETDGKHVFEGLDKVVHLYKASQDTQSPQLTSNIENKTYTTAFTPQITYVDNVTLKDDLEVMITLDGENYAIGTAIGIANGLEAQHELMIKLTDTAGNVTQETYQFSTKIAAPVVTPPVVTPPAVIPPAPVATSKLTLSESVVTLLLDGETKEQTITLKATARDTSDPVVWTSSDIDVATVENGKVQAVGVGEAVITATLGRLKASCTVTVEGLLEEETPLAAVAFKKPYISGFPDKTFRPKATVTRAQVATIFASVLDLNLDVPGQQQFVDVDVNHWAFPYVQAMSRTGIFAGYEDGQFDPSASITRAEMAQVILNYWQYLHVEISQEQFDTGVQNHWAAGAINAIYGAGIQEVFEDTIYQTDVKLLREEIVAMINRVIDRAPDMVSAPVFTDVDKTNRFFGDIQSATQLMQ